jgi:hypothetical protein
MRATLDSLAERLALECEMENPRFDRERFLSALRASQAEQADIASRTGSPSSAGSRAFWRMVRLARMMSGMVSAMVMVPERGTGAPSASAGLGPMRERSPDQEEQGRS